INLSWTDNSSNETGFEIWRSTTGQNGTYSSLATVGANVRTYSNTGLSASTQYCYQVRASGSTPSAFSNSSCATTSGGGSGGSGAASNLTATARTYREVDLTWQNNSSSVTTNEVWRSTTGISGSYTAIAWLSGTRQTYQNMSLTQNKQYCYKIKALTSSGSLGFSDPTCATTPNLDPSSVRVVTFGDSNTDRCNDPVPASDLGSYVSRVPRLAFDDPNLSCQVAGHIESRWSQSHSNAITAVNHGITATTTGGGSFGGPNRTSSSAPNARTVVNNVTRFAGEVLGDAYPWSGGESYNTSFPNGPIKRWNAFPPRTSNDFVYVALGTNDVASGMTTAQTLANLTWMVDQWTGRGLPASHFIIATLPPRTDGNFGAQISAINDGIRSLASNRGLRLVDLAAFTSNDNGVTWKDNSLQVGDGVHYVDSVRDWIAGQIVSLIAPLVS
ncbi:MAG TPA: SGNH/GDSL hydrolase family protein, partial [Gemmatimonadales bacterium]|nr:SGNH/GDSL hydrolase family protein [Gemmatimonadales bacterium]